MPAEAEVAPQLVVVGLHSQSGFQAADPFGLKRKAVRRKIAIPFQFDQVHAAHAVHVPELPVAWRHEQELTGQIQSRPVPAFGLFRCPLPAVTKAEVVGDH